MSAKIQPASALASAGLHWDIVNSKIWTSDFQSTLASAKAPRSTASPVAIRTVATFLPFRSATVLIWPAFSAVAISEASSPMIPPTMRRSVPLAMCASGAVVPKAPMSSLPATTALRPSAELTNSISSTLRPSWANKPCSLATKNLAWPVTGR